MSKLNESGYIFCKSFVDENTIKTISQYFENRIARKEWKSKEDTQGPSAFEYYADPLIEVMLKECLPIIEKETDLRLHPTYSFSRVYQENEELKPHTDRPSCEISVTINVARKGSRWPIWMQYKNNDPAEFKLEAGDAVIYKGCEVTHWRKPLKQDNLNVQFMLHYVNQDGPYSNYKFDKRQALGFLRS